ncbi:MAG: hypothetical protein P8P74_01300 [Crocinitomicaceae bacterium]|nr:hypothetical protein [Crocinitomicaceae bacterium]
MKKILLVFVLILFNSAPNFAQEDLKKITANFAFNWNDHLLPNSPFLVYHGKDESYFIDSSRSRVPDHSYTDIKTGGNSHFIVQDGEGFHILNSQLERVTKKAYDNIELSQQSELKLTSGEQVTFYTWDYDKQAYDFTDIQQPTPPWAASPERTSNSKLGSVNDSRFRSKRIERLRLGIDMSETLTVGQKGKNILVKKGETIVYKGPSKPMLFYDFAITGTKGPHSLYHPISKKPILENCDRFWCVGSYLVVSIKGSLKKHIVSSSGEIILTSAGEIRYYDYTFGGNKYSFFCDGRSLVNMNGDLIYKSDGELIGVGEHYIYSGYSGAYLGDLAHTIKMECSSFDRYNNITVAKIGRNKYRLYDSKSVLVNEMKNYYMDKDDSLIVCVTDSKTIICDPFSEDLADIHGVYVEGRLVTPKKWKYFVTSVDTDDTPLEGRFDPKKGIMVKANYLKVEWPESEKYHVVITKEGLVRYLDSDGQELFD